MNAVLKYLNMILKADNTRMFIFECLSVSTPSLICDILLQTMYPGTYMGGA